ncbi:hypothetical protein F2Q68_00023828 [Brassica cretica]|uniref:Thioredoxin domain-containing protein n=1 Tax=Brassica cretica TaxID=69181 RepID=A0A8S9IAC7_BRACR|nr:hypothetical protein F2Q68_00023828 [Brassica cretica]
MTTRSDSDDCLMQDPLTSSEKASISLEDSPQNSLKVVSLPPLENDSVLEISSKNQVKSSPFASVPEKDVETVHEKEAQAMDVDCPGVYSLSEASSSFLEDDKVREELQQDDVHKMETDVSVVCNSEKKGQEDSDVQRLLEAEKRRLLAEIETGTIFRKKEDVVETLEKNQKVERVRVKDNAFVGRSVKIDVVDDTALLNVVPFCSKKGKDHHPKRSGAAHSDDKEAPRKHKKTVGKHQHDETSGDQLRIMYSLNQMKSMRYANMANQRRLWSDMYARLVPELVSEYEGLVSLKKNQKSSKSGVGVLGTKEGMDDLTLDEEGEGEEYTEDNDDYNSILKPAFAVDGEPDFESGPPEDGFEYIRRVRWEAKRVPNVKVAKIDESKYIPKEQSVYMPQIPEIPKCPEHLLPLKEWEDSLLSDFSHLRLLGRWEDAVRDYEFVRRELPGDGEVAESLERAKIAMMNRSQESKSFGYNNQVEAVSSLDKFKNIVSLPGVSVFHFKSSSNRQCEEISPFINTLCLRYPLVHFFMVDVEESLALAKAESIRKVPTFKMYKNGDKVKEMICPSHQFLEDSIKQFLS